MSNDYYVYVYIDPRNNEEFYIGKGCKNRKVAHLKEEGVKEKNERIRAIRAENGLEPIIRVIARGLTQREAFLVEKTLLWKLGKTLTNVASGNFAEKFRPHDKLHIELAGYDFENGIFKYEVGEGPHRNWDDYTRFGFISAGGEHPRWGNAMLQFNKGDVVAAHLKRRGKVGGYVGIGVITGKAAPIRDVKMNGRPLLSLELKCKGMAERADSDMCEYVAKVKWVVAVERQEGKWRKGLFKNQLVRASLANQHETLAFLEQEFGVKFEDIAKKRELGIFHSPR